MSESGRQEGWELDEAGYLKDPLRWTPAAAEALAKAAGIGRLTPRHWKVLLVCREAAARDGAVPSLERLANLCGLEPDQLARLFPGSTVETVIRLAGLPRSMPDASGARRSTAVAPEGETR